MLSCKGKTCEHFRQYYTVIKDGTGYRPNLELPTDKYCKHPSIFKPKGKVDDNGINIMTLKICPLL